MGKKVLFTASTWPHLWNFHLPYLRRFREEGWTVHGACGGRTVSIPCVDEAVELPLEKSMRSPKNFQAAAILRKKIWRERYDLVVTHTSLAAFFTRLAMQGMRDRPLTVNMVHGYLFDDATPWLKRNVLLAAERWMAPVTDLALTMNRWDCETAKRYGLGRRVEYIPGVGVDFSRFNVPLPDSRQRMREEMNIPEKAFVLIYAAEFSARKSQAVLIRAMERLPEQAVLVLAGDGALRGECEALAERLGVSGRVRFPGHLRDMAPWYAMADAAVSASRIEGLPFNVMEAMYAGLPVAASAVKGHQDLIENDVTGLLYPYGDAAACAEQILRLMESESLRRNLSKNAKEKVAQYSLDRVLPIVWAQYAGIGDGYAVQKKEAGVRDL